MIAWTGFASIIIQERCFIEGLQAWSYKDIAPTTLIYFLIASPQFAQLICNLGASVGPVSGTSFLRGFPNPSTFVPLST